MNETKKIKNRITITSIVNEEMEAFEVFRELIQYNNRWTSVFEIIG